MLSKRAPFKKAFSLIELSVAILIIGILIAGAIKGGTLINKMRLSTARSLTQSAPVSSVKDLILWLDSTSSYSFIDSETENKSPITTWYDLNPTTSNRNNFTGVSGSSPLYTTNCINSLPCVKFSGYEYMEAKFDSGRTSKITIFAVTIQDKSPIYAAGTILVTKDWNDELNNSAWLYYAENSGGFQIRYYENDLAKVGDNASYLPIELAHIATVVDNETNYKIYYDGKLSDEEVVTTFQTGVVGPNIFQVGGWYYGGFLDYAFKGSIGEIIVFNRALKEEERQSIEKYLAKKWGVTVSS